MTAVDSLRVTRGPEAGALDGILAIEGADMSGNFIRLTICEAQAPAVAAALVTAATERLTTPAREAMTFACVGAAEQALDEHRQRQRPR